MGKKFNSSKSALVLGGQIKRKRLAKGLTLVQLGLVTGVNHSQISRYERGRMSTVSSNLQKICTFLHIESDPELTVSASTSLGKKVDELIRMIPDSEPSVMKLVEALEGLLMATNVIASPR